ncbi:JAB domain-containing protein [Wolbachia endosymbiont of Folsomia candida]|uniref:JAB domain-containing protein n=1 Tax=Wolbachia endosymbiont of Folsomia candida TaxID=169402 RepID=UPI000B0E4BD1|nr:DNA repair protein RadC [Wolbachia endosymbiont of Folsomia candida]APR98613.1 DNA repair protein RadC [Wolbachia endosymbiont of Folsomia candida]APR98685.1 DNA repair protein RadC [Wolbachia endosymbiont of Folsomia candida]APR99041.1 DNA repair protein RadC [Wolbachia endosymbiont of Folsomia candida]
MNNSENKRKTELEKRVLASKGRSSLLDLELVELILYSSFNNGENKEVAERLLELFKSIGKVISADFHELKSVTGMNDSAIASIMCVRETIERMLREDLEELPIIENQKKLIEYLRVTIGQLSIENFRVIYLNKKSRIIDEYTQEGTVDKTPLYAREVIKRALLVGATAMVIAHNHLGSAKPSQHDISLTKILSLACSSMEIELIDHIIVTEKNYFR